MKLFKNPYTIDEISYNILTGGHVLIAGTTGSGKSTMLETFLYNLCKQHPNNYQFAIVDLKRVSLTRWKQCPHIKYYASTATQAKYIINCTVATMYERLNYMEQHGQQKFTGTKLFLIIDETADLLSTCKDTIPQLVKLGRLARATNIALVYCTQSPSKKTIPADLQVNLNVLIALHCRDPIASRQIIGEKGAELLPRVGECLYYTPENVTVKKAKAVKISDQEIEKYLQDLKSAGYVPTMIAPKKKNKNKNFLSLFLYYLFR